MVSSSIRISSPVKKIQVFYQAKLKFIALLNDTLQDMNCHLTQAANIAKFVKSKEGWIEIIKEEIDKGYYAVELIQKLEEISAIMDKEVAEEYDLPY